MSFDGMLQRRPTSLLMVISFALHREALIARNGVGPLPSDSESPILPLYERAENIPKQRVEPCPTASHAVMLPLHHVGDESSPKGNRTPITGLRVQRSGPLNYGTKSQDSLLTGLEPATSRLCDERSTN